MVCFDIRSSMKLCNTIVMILLEMFYLLLLERYVINIKWFRVRFEKWIRVQSVRFENQPT